MWSSCLIALVLQGSDQLCTVQRTELLPRAGVVSPSYGRAVGVTGDLAAVGSAGDGVGGAVFLFAQEGGRWEQQSVLEPPQARPGDSFGIQLKLEQSRLLVGATWTKDPSGLATGSVHVFEPREGIWSARDQIFPAGATNQEVFGASIAADEERILIGALASDTLGYNSGAAYVFRRDGDVWVQEARLLPDPSASPIYGAKFGLFGTSVALRGKTALVGAPGLSFAYVFELVGETWEQRQLIEDKGGFGESLALGDDSALIGAAMWPSPGNPFGAVHEFVRRGGIWERASTIKRALAEAATVGFGGFLAQDGDLVAIGSLLEVGIYPTHGTWLVERRGDRWSDPLPIVPLGSMEPFPLGYTVAISGRRLLVGSTNSGFGPGRAFLFDVGSAAADGSITTRQGPGNLQALTARPVAVGTKLVLEVGPAPGPFYSATIFAYEEPASIPFGSGTLLCQEGENGLLFTEISLGLDNGAQAWTTDIPPLRELAGFTFCVQAVLRSPFSPSVLTNAVDVEVGTCDCSATRSALASD